MIAFIEKYEHILLENGKINDFIRKVVCRYKAYFSNFNDKYVFFTNKVISNIYIILRYFYIFNKAKIKKFVKNNL